MRKAYIVTIFFCLSAVSCFPQNSDATTNQAPVVLTNTPFFTASPTSSTEISTEKISDLMKTNGLCADLCFWGIIPNESTFDNSVMFLDSLGKGGLLGTYDFGKYFNITYLVENKLSIGAVILEENDLVKTINVSIRGLQQNNITLSDWAPFTPNQIIQKYGKPTKIEVGFGEGQNGFISYQMLFSYHNISLYILYSGEDNAYRPDATLHACPLAKNKIGGFDMSIGDSLNTPLAFMYSIEQISNLSLIEFSEMLSGNQEDTCFDFDLSMFYK